MQGVSKPGRCHPCGAITAWSLSKLHNLDRILDRNSSETVLNHLNHPEKMKMKYYDLFNMSTKLPLTGDEMRDDELQVTVNSHSTPKHTMIRPPRTTSPETPKMKCNELFTKSTEPSLRENEQSRRAPGQGANPRPQTREE